MKLAVVGTGISGLVAAWLLQREHEVTVFEVVFRVYENGNHTVFEARDRIGGHSNTVDVEVDGRSFAIDTGFIVHNDRTYPNVTLVDRRGAHALLSCPDLRALLVESRLDQPRRPLI